MDNLTAKHILSVYRSNGSDASDPHFRKALAQTKSDPRLQDWFKSEIDFDMKQAATMKSITAPANGKTEILATADFNQLESSTPSRSRISKWWLSLSAAALVAISATLWQTLSIQPAEIAIQQPLEIARFAEAALPLDQSIQNISALGSYLQKQKAPFPDRLPDALVDSANLKGCKVFADGQGGKISLICFEKSGQLVHLFVFDSSSPLGENLNENSWVASSDWNIYSWERGDQQFAIASKVTSSELDSIIARI